MFKYIKKFEQVVSTVLIVLMSFVVVVAIADLLWLLIKDAITPPILLLDTGELLEIFSMFLLVLIGIELIETLKAYVQHSKIRAEVIILVAMIALGRKIIGLDLKEVSYESMLGISAMMVALSISYYTIHRSNNNSHDDSLTVKKNGEVIP